MSHERSHKAVVKVAQWGDAQVQVIIECDVCGRIEFPPIAPNHLMTVANAAHDAAVQLGVWGLNLQVADVEASTEAEADAQTKDRVAEGRRTLDRIPQHVTSDDPQH